MVNRVDGISCPTLRPAARYKGRLCHLTRLRPRCRERFPGELSDANASLARSRCSPMFSDANVLLESRIEVRHDAGVDGSGECADDRVARQLCPDLRVGQVGCLPIRRRVPETTRQACQKRREIDKPLSLMAKSTGHARRRCSMYSAAFTAESHSELLIEPSPHETNEIASVGHSPCGRCPMASARPTACGPWLARVDVTRKSYLGSPPREQCTPPVTGSLVAIV